MVSGKDSVHLRLCICKTRSLGQFYPHRDKASSETMLSQMCNCWVNEQRSSYIVNDDNRLSEIEQLSVGQLTLLEFPISVLSFLGQLWA